MGENLDPTLRLTDFAPLKPNGWKLPQVLCNLTPDSEHSYSLAHLGIGLDCTVKPLRHAGLFLLETTDLLYAVVDDPYVMGKIACANVLSDLYALGVVNCDNILILLAASTKMLEKKRDVVMSRIMAGFKDCAMEAGAKVTELQYILNTWCIIGGLASSVCKQTEFIVGNNAAVGDVLILTKPLGTQPACIAYRLRDRAEFWNRIKDVVSKEDVRKLYEHSTTMMSRLNRMAAILMHKYNAHGATDIGGFGLLGHAKRLAAQQKRDLSFDIYRIPVLPKTSTIDKYCPNMFRLLQGYSPETSGGLLICLPYEKATAFCNDFQKAEGYNPWIIGIVEKGNKTARLIENPQVIETQYGA